MKRPTSSRFRVRKGCKICDDIAPETSGLSDEQIASRQAKLKALSDQLIADAQGTSERAKSFQEQALP